MLGAVAAVLAVNLVPVSHAWRYPRLPLLVTAGLIVTVSAAFAWKSKAPLAPIVRRVLMCLPMLLALLLSIVLSQAQDWSALGAMLIRALVSLEVMLVLSATTPASELFAALERLRAPAVFVGTLRFMDRYLHVFDDELGRMRRARAARTFDRRWWPNLEEAARLVATLFVRAFERAERIHRAVLARTFRP